MHKSIAAAIGALSLGSAAAQSSADTRTVTGEVVSLSCYFDNKKNVGKAGLLCALATARYEGNPVGLLTADGSVYQLAGGLAADNNAKCVPLLGHTVTVTGNIYQQAGMPMISADSAKVLK